MFTTGFKRYVKRKVSASGISTACGQYKAATASAMIPHPLFMAAGVAAGLGLRRHHVVDLHVGPP